MAEQSAAEKKHAPTLQRIKKAREEGKVPQSQEVSSALMLVTLLGLLAACAGSLLNCFSDLISRGVSYTYRPDMTEADLMSSALHSTITAVGATAPFLLGTLVVSIAGSFLVSGWSFSPKAAKVDFSKINPVKGMKNLFNSRSLVTLVTALVKLTVLVAIVWEYVHDKKETLLSLTNCTLAETLSQIGSLVMGVSVRIVLAILAIAGADLVWQKWKYKRELRMTDQEMKEERKQYDGNPQVKGRIRTLQIEMARKRMLQAVSQADVVLVNPTHVAVAMRYDMATMAAPIVLAKGGDLLCEKIKEIARAHSVPIVHRPELARAIFGQVDINEPIPETLFVAVAEVLAMVYRVNRARRRTEAPAGTRRRDSSHKPLATSHKVRGDDGDGV
ncbi:MAG: flagellar biosynthesis protein FlhB [Phycisphaerae bacterium]|nr:flagellar biosynthesis protein FlhB [Phycisphaerae bacterium]